MLKFFTNPKYRMVLEFLCAALVQMVVYVVVFWLESGRRHADYISEGLQALGVVLWSGPQTVFLVHRGGTKQRLVAAITYIGVSLVVLLGLMYTAYMLVILHHTVLETQIMR